MTYCNKIQHRAITVAFFLTLALWLYLSSIHCNILVAMKDSELIMALPMLARWRIGWIALLLMSFIPIVMANATFGKKTGYVKKFFNWLCICQGTAQCLQWAIANIYWASSPGERPSVFISVALLLSIILWIYSVFGIVIMGTLMCFPVYSENIEHALNSTLKDSLHKTNKNAYMHLVSEEIKNSSSFTYAVLLIVTCIPYRIYNFFYDAKYSSPKTFSYFR